MSDIPKPESITLADGRTLCFARYGARAGRPVIYLHGAGSSRLEGVYYDERARAAGITLIATDRPGCGGSSPDARRARPGYTYSSYAEDIRELADALGIGTFVVAGMSNGGAYAMAAAARLRDRITAAIPINATTPVHDPIARRASPASTRLSYLLLRHAPFLALRGVRRFASSGDELRHRTAREALRQPDSGYIAQEIRLASRDWGFDHLAVSQPVEIFSGERDAGHGYAPIWAQRLPAGRLHVIAGGHGDFSAPAAVEKIVAAMAAASDASL
jgi:pimeloyl-ACP methyl ester carboxylesterase